MTRRVPREKTQAVGRMPQQQPGGAVKLASEANGLSRNGMSALPTIMPPSTMNGAIGGRTRAKSFASRRPSNGSGASARPASARPGWFE